MKIIKRDDGKWVFDFTLRGKRHKRVINSKAEAEEALTAQKNDIYRERYGFGRKKPEVLFEAHADEFLELYSKQNKRSWTRDETSLNHLKEFFKGKRLSEITPDLIEKYRLKRRADGMKPATVNRERSCLVTCLQKAIEWERLEKNPALMVKKFREANAKERILTVDEMKRLLDAASPELRPVLVIGLNSAMRRGEILGLRWKDVDFVKGFILIGDSKSGKSRRIPMNALVFETLHEMNRKREFVFENPDTRTAVKDVKTAFKGACRRAEIKGVRFHDLRHTAASRMIELGADIVSVKEILGHASIQMTMRYCHPTDESKRRALAKLGEIFDETRKAPVSAEISRPVSYLKRDN